MIPKFAESSSRSFSIPASALTVPRLYPVGGHSPPLAPSSMSCRAAIAVVAACTRARVAPTASRRGWPREQMFDPDRKAALQSALCECREMTSPPGLATTAAPHKGARQQRRARLALSGAIPLGWQSARLALLGVLAIGLLCVSSPVEIVRRIAQSGPPRETPERGHGKAQPCARRGFRRFLPRHHWLLESYLRGPSFA